MERYVVARPLREISKPEASGEPIGEQSLHPSIPDSPVGPTTYVSSDIALVMQEDIDRGRNTVSKVDGVYRI